MIAQIDGAYIRKRPWKLWPRMLSYAFYEGRPLTTKGQWINPLVFSLFSIEKKIPSMHRVEKPVFILGTGRSGTTILGVVLSMHREVGFLNEPKALWHSIHPNEDLIGSYSRDSARYRLDPGEATPERIRAAYRIYGSYLKATFSNRVVDKYPELIFRVPFVKKIFPDAKFIFLTRDVWNTCHSIERWSSRLGVTNGDEVHDWWGVNNRKWVLLKKELIKADEKYSEIEGYVDQINSHKERAVIEWVVTMQEGIKLVNEYPEDVLKFSYEELVNDPEQSLQRLLDFAELPEDKVFMEYAKETLKPVKDKGVFELSSVIQGLVNETMASLGYIRS